MYPECRHIRPSGDSCRAAALKGSHFCYFHGRLHDRYRSQAARERLHNVRNAAGRFTPAHHTLDARPGQPPLPHLPADAGTAAETAHIPTSDYGAIPVAAPAPTPHNASLTLPPVEDSASIQLALIDVLNALAENRLDPKRAGLLLYGLQVASANAKHVLIHSDSIRSLTYTDDGIPLAPQDYGWDVEDIEEFDKQDMEDDDESSD